MDDTKNGIIAFQGEPGANSDIACSQVFPSMQSLACPTFEDAFTALGSRKSDLAMIPIENSLAGRVADIHHLLPNSNFNIIGEYFMPIHLHLMVIPGAKIDTIKTIHSHVHALGQCRNIIKKNHWKAVVSCDTAGAARQVRDSADPKMAALASNLAAELYKLDILIENVEDSKNNTTRFIILSREPEIMRSKNTDFITTFIFQVRNIPSALYKVMGGFATNGVNMTKLESYQLDGKFNATQFYADIEGHPENHNVALALEEMNFFSQTSRILGTYPASPFRKNILV